MYRILRNCFLSSNSGLKTVVVLDEEHQETNASRDPTTPESLLLAEADRALLQSALAELPVPFREILLLCEVEDMSYQEMAETLASVWGP
jgi:RNA polymerase sigma-70 factor (ECF subfamily)